MAVTEHQKAVINTVCHFIEGHIINNPDYELDHLWIQGLYTDFEWGTFIVNKIPHNQISLLTDSVRAGHTSWNALYGFFIQHSLQNPALFPGLSSLVEDIQNRKDHFRFIRRITEERGLKIKVHFATVKASKENHQHFDSKWCRLISLKQNIFEDPHDQELYNQNGNTLVTLNMDEMYFLNDSSSRHADSTLPILMHLVVDESLFPNHLRHHVKADNTIKVEELEKWNSLWMDSDWHLASAVYGAFAGLDHDLDRLAKNTHQQVAHRRQCKRSSKRNALQPSVNISQVRPDFQGNIGPISNIKKGNKHKVATPELIDGRNYMFDFFINMLSTFYKAEVQKWRKLAYGRSISLQGVSRTTICGFCQDGYSAMLHLDADNPTHTYGLRFFRPQSLKNTEYQMVLPTVSVAGKDGLIIGQDTGSITVWAGIRLMHTNSLGTYQTLDKGMAPGMVVVQKPRTFSKTHNLEEKSNDGLGDRSGKEAKRIENGYYSSGRFEG